MVHESSIQDLGSLKMEGKAKVKYFNQRFTRILKNFAADTKPHDSITIYYYMSALPINIVQFVKWNVKPTLLENYEKDIVVEKDLWLDSSRMMNQQGTPKMRVRSPMRWRARVEKRKKMILKPSLTSSGT